MKRQRSCAYCDDRLVPMRRIPLCFACRVTGATIFGLGAAAAGVTWGILVKVFG